MVKIRSVLVRVFMGAFIICALAAFIIVNTSKPRVLILHSYDTEYSWVRDINTALNRKLGTKPYILRWHYMDTKRNPDDAFKQRSGVLARRIIDEWRPDILIAIDDDAQRYAARFYANDPRLKIVFAGINGEIAPYGYDKAKNVTGILERKQWLGVKNLILEAVRPRVPADRPVKIAYIGDTSGSVKEDTHFLEAFDWKPFILHRSKLVKTFDEWKAEATRANEEADVLVTTNYRRIQVSEADAKKFVAPEDLVKWTEDNTPKIPVIGTNGFYVEDGGMIAIATSPFEQGRVAAEMTVAILDKKADPKSLPVQATQQFISYMRADRMAANNFIVPQVYESFSRAMNNYYEPEKAPLK
jgi:ABC transporter substrate binding protein